MQEKLLSICIPTYNRAECLDASLNRLVEQISSNQLENCIELLIIDNASIDNTQEVVEQFMKKAAFMRYIRNSTNLGIDGNIYKCTKEAVGKYVHLLSDDDVVINNGVVKIIETIRDNKDVDFFFLNLQIFSGDFDMNKLGSPVFKDNGNIIFVDKNLFVQHIWLWATFVSSFVLKREVWFETNDHESYIGTDIYLSYALFDHLCNSRKMMFIGEPLLALRAFYSGNYRVFYAFAYQWHRLLMQHAIAKGYDYNIMNKIYKRTIVKSLVPRALSLRTSGQVISTETWAHIYEPTRKYWVSWLLLYPIVLAPSWFFRMAKKLYKLGK